MPKAYVLINAAHAKIDGVREQLAALKPQVIAADMIMGPYDLVAIVTGADVDEIGRLIIRDVQRIDGVERTLTCMVIEPDKK